MIKEHQCGEAVPPRDPEAFADALCKLADNPELRRKYGQNARRLAEERFSRERLAGEFVRWIEGNRRAEDEKLRAKGRGPRVKLREVSGKQGAKRSEQ